jgi:N-acetyl-anhydromuramyl-L-alanine amidase AmpD
MLERYQGILGHYHVQLNKVDPGPAFQWDTVIDGASVNAGGPSVGSRKTRHEVDGFRILMIRNSTTERWEWA